MKFDGVTVEELKCISCLRSLPRFHIFSAFSNILFVFRFLGMDEYLIVEEKRERMVVVVMEVFGFDFRLNYSCLNYSLVFCYLDCMDRNNS